MIARPQGIARFKIYAITRREGREMVRWTDTKLRKDHHEPVDRLLERCHRELDGFTRADAEAFREVRTRFLAARGQKRFGRG
jgi:hypothetical protein